MKYIKTFENFSDLVEEKKMNPGFKAYLDKKKDKNKEKSKPDFLDLDKDGDKEESMKKSSKDKKEEDKKEDKGKGLTAAQKKLPAGLQKAILSKK